MPELPKGVQGVQLRFVLAPAKAERVMEAQYAEGGKPGLQGRWPVPASVFRTVWLPPPSDVRDTIELAAPTAVERKLFRVALGAEFQFDLLAGLSPRLFDGQLARAEERLNGHLGDFLPATLGLSWAIRGTSDRKGVHCFLKDAKGGYTALGSRGAGVRRVMSVLAWLMAHDFDTGFTAVLFDEPETSLHADSQHLLRRVLESLGAKPNVQVVYATHSPSMINVMRPHAIRLLRRVRRQGKATTVIDNHPFKDNYLPVRASLGLTPADSLLYAPVTVVVEGDTEVIAIQTLLLKLADAGVPGFEHAKHLLSQSHFLDGMGDRYPFVCQMAKSQGAKPVIFLDGDKKRHLAKHKLDQTHPDVPIVTLADGEEVEQLVPEEVYFRALADVLGHGAGQVTAENYRLWNTTANLPPKMAFTKRVGRWLDTLGLPEPGKAQVMRKAVELADVGRVNTTPLLELVRHIECLLSP